MVEIRKAQLEAIPQFVQMEQSAGTSEFIIPYSHEEHCKRMADPKFVYLSILENEALVGFMILYLERDGNSVEFRRIVVSAKGKGIGQKAIESMETFCQAALCRNRIWLDVFEFNHRGRHIYEKLGYKQFGHGTHEGKKLLLFEKCF